VISTLRFAPVNVFPVAVKVTWVALAGTATLAGKLAVVALEPLRAIEVPLGAGPLKVIVPVDVPLFAIAGGERANPTGTGGCTVSVAGLSTPALEATMLTWLVLVTGWALTGKVTLVAFAGTVTLACTVAIAVLALWSVTAKPAGAGPLS
jgi:hypothetical protein